MRKIFALAACLLAGPMAATGASAATLAGDQVSINLSTTGYGSWGTQTPVVGTGAEGDYFEVLFYDFNAGAKGDLFTLTSSAHFCGVATCGNGTGSNIVTWTLSSLDFGTPLRGFEILTTLGQAWVANLTDTSVTIKWYEDQISQGTFFSGRFITDDATVSPVPLPATLPALALGLGTLGALRRRRKA